MACCIHRVLIVLAGIPSLVQAADDMAWGDVSADGSLETHSLDVPVATAVGAENFFIENPMDSHDWTHTSVVRKTLLAELRASSAKVAVLEEELRPIFSAMPKDAGGRLNNGTARYALHRLFSAKHGWSIKGLQPAGAAWATSLSVTPDVKDVTKYMVPTYLQQLLSAQLRVEGFDLHSLAILAAAMEHLIHAETESYVYSVFTTLGLPIPGERTEKEVDEVLDAFMMVYAFGLNLDVSVLEDVQKARAQLERWHSGWPQLQSLARNIRSASFARELSFPEIVQVVEKIQEGYAQWQGKDCLRVKEELMAKPSHRDGHVQLSEVSSSHAMGRRSLFTESAEELEKLGVLSTASDTGSQLIISNYVNSQSMCLSTASFYTACCINECEGLLARLEREVAAPSAEPNQLAKLMAALPGPGLSEALVQEIPSLIDQDSGLVSLHGRALAGWMHRAFPLECPAPNSHKVTNPKTPDEWIGESGLQVQELEEMMSETAQVLKRYTTMGKSGEEIPRNDDPLPDPSIDVVRIHPTPLEQEQPRHLLVSIFRLAAMSSMMGLVVIAGKSHLRSGLLATRGHKDKVFKDFV